MKHVYFVSYIGHASAGIIKDGTSFYGNAETVLDAPIESIAQISIISEQIKASAKKDFPKVYAITPLFFSLLRTEP